MGEKTILDRHQKEFLDLILKEPYLLKHYYWTGGTVLSEFYLKHRESYDIDLFSEKEVDLPSVQKFVGIVGQKLKAVQISHNKEELKVDFNYYPFPRINKSGSWKGLAIDSLEDIAVNKIHTLSVKPRGRDFADIFFIFKKKKFSLKGLISLAKAKFDWHIDPIQLGETFTESVAYQDLPKMLIPYNQKKMDDFFLKLAKSLEADIFK